MLCYSQRVNRGQAPAPWSNPPAARYNGKPDDLIWILTTTYHPRKSPWRFAQKANANCPKCQCQKHWKGLSTVILICYILENVKSGIPLFPHCFQSIFPAKNRIKKPIWNKFHPQSIPIHHSSFTIHHSSFIIDRPKGQKEGNCYDHQRINHQHDRPRRAFCFP